MDTRPMAWRILAALLLIAILMGGASALFRAGWTQGYLIGGIAKEGGAAQAIPYGAYGWGAPGPFYGPSMGFSFGPWLCLIGIGLFFLLGGFFRFGGFGRWRGDPNDPNKPWSWEGGPCGRHAHMHMHPHTHEPAKEQQPAQDSASAEQ